MTTDPSASPDDFDQAIIDADLDPNPINDAIKKLRDAGFAVVIFTPKELGQADADGLCDVLIPRGWNFIETWNPENV